MSIKLSDVAREAGVSTATVSRVINNLSGYSDATREKVETTIRNLGYSPNVLARGLAGGKTHTIGVLLPSLSSRYSSQLIHGIETRAHSCGYSVIVCNTDRNGERTMEYLRILGEKRVDGVLFASEWLKDEYGEYMLEMQIPVVLIATFSSRFPFHSVRVDDRKAAYTATQYLANKGHKRISFISGSPEDPIAGRPRIEGYTGALEQHGLSFDPSLMAYGDFHFQSGIDAMEQLWSRNTGLTAVFASSDEMALGALTFLHSKNIDIPGEISVVGYDDTQDALMAVPALTTLHQPISEMGERAVELLFSKAKAENIIMPHRVVERKSVRVL